MQNLDLLSRLGLYIVPNFLSPEVCARFTSEAIAAPTKRGSVHQQGAEFKVDSNVRSVAEAKLSIQTSSTIEQQLRGLKKRLEEHFRLQLMRFEEPTLVIYRKGDFYRVHRDGYSDHEAADFLSQRRISVSISLNLEVETFEPGSYCGGALTFYGLLSDVKWESYGFPLHGDVGLLVAFPSSLYHEVETITAGERLSIVTWYS